MYIHTYIHTYIRKTLHSQGILKTWQICHQGGISLLSHISISKHVQSWSNGSRHHAMVMLELLESGHLRFWKSWFAWFGTSGHQCLLPLQRFHDALSGEELRILRDFCWKDPGVKKKSSKHHLFSVLSNFHLTIKQNLFHSPKIFQVFEFEVGEEVEVTSRLPVSILPPSPLLLLLSIPTARVDRDSIACGVPRSLWPPPVLGRWLPAIVHDVQPSSMLFLVMKAIRWLWIPTALWPMWHAKWASKMDAPRSEFRYLVRISADPLQPFVSQVHEVLEFVIVASECSKHQPRIYTMSTHVSLIRFI